MEKRIELEKRARKASQITELNLDNCRSTSIVGLSDEYTALETLSLINVGLTTLKGFPKLPNLKKLELSDNRISNGLNYLITSPKLQYLNLSGNKIKDLESLKPLEEFKNLAILDLFNNETTLIENYREKIFKMIPSLKYLDGLDCNDMEAPSENEDDVNGNDSYDDVSDSLSEEEDGSDDNDEDLEEEGDFDEGDVSLSEVYNEDIEDDNSDWDEEDAPADDDEDYDDFDDEEEGGGPSGNGENAEAKAKTPSSKGKTSASDAEAANNKEKAAPLDDESQTRGKKRKHDG